MPSNRWTPMLRNNLSLCNKSLRARINVAHVEFFRGLARPVPGYSVTATYRNRACRIQNIFLKIAKPRNNFIATAFGKSLFITQYRMRYAICMPLNKKDLTLELTMFAYGNRQNAIKFAGANNSDSLRAIV